MSARLVVENTLTSDERELLNCYRKADIRRRKESLRRMQRICEDHPILASVSAASAASGIRLVTSFGKEV